MAYDREDYVRQHEQESRDFYNAVASLTPGQRAAWEQVYEDHEFFDGEHGIAHGTLERYLADGRLGK